MSGQVAFGRIALSLSGGGYRAAAFHLGTLDLLHRLGLLENVRALSTVSGGTIVGARWALAQARGEPFEHFFRAFSRTLVETNVISRAVDALAEGGRRRSVITAAADVYAGSGLLGDARFGEVMALRSHVHEWCFNATEFRTGLAFRFQASRTGAVIGNGRIPLAPELAAHLRLADIVAASSCFPGAFEPIVFPRDFALDEAAAALAGELEPLALLDGGIYDNQGIDALLLAEQRAGEGEKFDLFLVSDSHRARSSFLEPPEAARPGGLRLRTLLRLGETVVGAAGIAALLLAVDTVRHFALLDGLDAAVRVGAVAMLLGFVGGSASAWQWLRHEVRAQLPEASDALWRAVGELRGHEALSLLNVRARSLLAMSADVFMKRVRGLSYERLFREAGDERTVSNLIYDLRTAAERRRPGPTPSERQRALAEAAAEVKTALWLDRGEADLRDLVACGHNTLCLNLLEHLRDHFGDDPGDAPPDVRALRERLEALWEALAGDPYALLDRQHPVASTAA